MPPESAPAPAEDRASRAATWRAGVRAWWRERWPRWRVRVKAMALGVAVGVLLALIVVEWAAPGTAAVPSALGTFGGAVGRFFRAFVLSPGIGALAAVIAAVVAFESSRHVTRTQHLLAEQEAGRQRERDKEEEARQAARAEAEERRQRDQAGRERAAVLDDREEDRWYRMYELVFTNADTLSPDAAALAVEALDALADDDEKTAYVIALTKHLYGRQTP